MTWRRQLREHGVRGLASKKRGPAAKEKPSVRELQLEREKKKLAKAELIIEFQEEVHRLLGSHELDERSARGIATREYGRSSAVFWVALRGGDANERRIR